MIFSVTSSLLLLWVSVATAAMTEIRVGDTVLYHDHAYVVRGISPMGTMLKRVMLEDPDTHELVDAPTEDLRPYDEDDA
jgi:hypothetical protein